MIGWKKKTLCAPHWAKVLTNYIGFNSFLDKGASSLIGRLNYQLILNLSFKGRGTNFFKINIFMLKKMKDS